MPLSQFAMSDSRYKIVLKSTLFIGVLSQGMGLFNKYSVLDDPENYSVGVDYTSGRWMLGFLGDLEKRIYGDGHLSLPLFNGFLAILLIAASAYLIINLLNIKNKLSCAYISGIMVAFPVVTCIFGYMFTAHFYMFSLFLSVLGSWLICKMDRWYYWLFGIILISASTGIYQAFFPVTITLVLMFLISQTLNIRNRGLYKKALISCACSVASLGLYFGINNMVLSYKNLVLSDYKGINSVWKVPVQEYLNRIIVAYMDFFTLDNNISYPFNSNMHPYHIQYIYLLIISGSLFLCIIQLLRIFKYDWKRSLFFACLVLLFPLCVNLIIVMAGKNETHTLMVYAQVFPFILFAWLIEKLDFHRASLQKAACYAVLSIMLLSLGMYCRVDNKCYLRATFAQQNAISYFTTLITQIKSTEGYRDEMPVVFINSESKTDMTFYNSVAFSNLHFNPYYMDGPGYVNTYSWTLFMKQWCGFAPTIVDSREYERLEEVINMPHYPDYGAIKNIHNTIVVKF